MSENMETVRNEGNIRIADDVIASIAAIAAGEVDGVSSLGGGLDISELLGKKQPIARGIKISYAEESLVVDIIVYLKYGVVVLDTAKKIQENVMNAIESMTGKTVSCVNITVGGITLEKSAE